MSSAIRLISAACLGVVSSVLLASGALAQPADLPVAAEEDWQHDWTLMTFPARIGGFERESVSQFEDRQTNISGGYRDRDTGTFMTIYVYRPGNPAAAIWFDRALIPIGATESYGSVDLDAMKIGTFAPAGTSVESGQFAVMAVDGNIRSTALALYRADEWLVKVRISSRELSVRRMNNLLRETMAILPAMAGLDTAPAYFIEECETPLATTQALPFNDPKGDLALGMEASISLMAGELATDEDVIGTPARYCRVGTRREQLNVYRANGSEDSYDVAIGDAGAGFTVFPLQLYGAEPGGKSGVLVHRVQSSNGLVTRIHRPFVGLPTIQQAADAVYQERAIAEVSRPLGGENVVVTLPSSSDAEAGSD